MAPALPQRVSLIAQTEEVLIEGMRAGRWQRRLPGERGLCEELQISRWTLRSALVELARQKLIRIQHGRACEIIAKFRPTRSPDKPWRLGYILPESTAMMRPFVALVIDEIREFVRKLGGQFNIYHRPKFYLTKSARALADFVAQNPHDCWILAVSTRPMQLWFENQGLPVIIGGSLHEGIQLPSINLDYAGVGRHAAGLVLARGHARAALLASNRGLPSTHVGFSELARGFKEAFADSHRAHQEPIVVFHSGETNAICRILDRLLDLPQRPTVVLVTDSATFLVVMTHLARRRMDIPRMMSVIVAEYEPYFSQIVPAPSHYEWVPRLFVKQWLSLLQKAADHTLSVDTRVRIVPRFNPGETLAPCEVSSSRRAVEPRHLEAKAHARSRHMPHAVVIDNVEHPR